MQELTKKTVIMAVIAVIYLLALSPYAVETAKDLYSNFRFYYLSGIDAFIPFIKKGPETDKFINGLFQEEKLSKSNKEKMVFILGIPSSYGPLPEEERISYLFQAIHRYPDEPILRYLLAQSLISTSVNPDYLIDQLEQGKSLDSKEPAFDYLIAYLERLRVASGEVKEEVIQKIKEGISKAKSPGYGGQLRVIAYNIYRKEKAMPEFYAMSMGLSLAYDFNMQIKLRELARYLSWASGFYLRKGELEKATVIAETEINLARQLENDRTIIWVLVGQAIETMGLGSLQDVYRQIGKIEGIEEIRLAKMRNHLWGKGITKHISDEMKFIVEYQSIFGTSYLSIFILMCWLVGFGSSAFFFYLMRKKHGEEYHIVSIRKRTYFILGLGLIIISCIVWVPMWQMTNIQFSKPEKLIIFLLGICLYIILIKILTPLLVRGELIYQGHKGSRLASWLIAKEVVFHFAKWGLICYLLLMSLLGMFIAKNNEWFRTVYFNEINLVPFPHVDKVVYSKEVNRLMGTVRAGKVYKTEKGSKDKIRQDTDAIRALGRVDAYEAVPELAEILRNTSDKELRDKIITVFGMFSQGVDPHSLEPFLNQENAIIAVGEIHHPESGAILLDYSRKTNNLSDLSTEKKASLALALARQDQIEEATGIIEEIVRTEEKIPYSIGTALDLLPVEESKRLLSQYLEKHDYEYYHVINESLRKNCDEMIGGKILYGLISKNRPIPSDLTEILSSHLNQSHIPLLIQGCGRKFDASVRNFCLYMLGRLKAKEGIPAAEDATADTDWVIKVNGICALGQIGDSSVIPVLKKAGEEKNLVVRSAAVWSLTKLE